MQAQRTTPLAGIALVALISAFATAAPAPAAAQTAAELRMPADAQPYRRVAEAFVASAMAGDVERSIGMLSRAVVERAGEPAVRSMMASRIVPFFRESRTEATPGPSVTVTHTTDASGNRGFAFYMWAAPRESAAPPRPFALYMVEEAGRIVVANVVPDRFVEGRHR